MQRFLSGGCLCGAVRYRIAAEPLSVSICHCATCRRSAGAQSVAWAVVPAAAFTLAGRTARFESSPGVERSHCPTCGTSLTWRGEAATVDVTLASLDDPGALVPSAEIWLSHRLVWEPVDPARRTFAEADG
jgi:hypothetical protein